MLQADSYGFSGVSIQTWHRQSQAGRYRLNLNFP